MRIPRYVARHVAGAFLGALGAALLLVLGIEFADRARFYTGPGWPQAVALLYACKAAVNAYQLAPAALVIAVQIAIASLKRRGEITALRALGASPAAVLGPCAAVGLAVAAALFTADESFVGRAGRRADEISAFRFYLWGDWGVWHGQKRWFRSGRSVYFLRDVQPDGTFVDASVFEVTSDFRLRARLDADRLQPLPDGRWQVQGGTRRTFEPDGRSEVTPIHDGAVALAEPARPFLLRTGRPEQFRLGEIRHELSVRSAVGLSAAPYAVALHNKLAHPLTAIPLAVLAAALALRPRRRDAAAVALVEGLGVVAAVWGAAVLLKAAAIGGRLAPWAAPWMVFALLSAAAIGAAARAVRR